MAKPSTGSDSLLKLALMLVVVVGGPWYLLAHTDAFELVDKYLATLRREPPREYTWGGGDAPAWAFSGPAEVAGGSTPTAGSIYDRAVAPASFEAPLRYDETIPAEPLVTPAPGEHSFRAIEQRLRELGAVYFVLETRELDPPRYRFLCRTALAGNEKITHKFEAIEGDPLTAMREVLSQVERWHSGW